jgi:hypothetical protein
MNNELEKMRKEADMALFGVLSRHSPGVAEGNHKKLLSGYSVSRSRFKPSTSPNANQNCHRLSPLLPCACLNAAIPRQSRES